MNDPCLRWHAYSYRDVTTSSRVSGHDPSPSLLVSAYELASAYGVGTVVRGTTRDGKFSIRTFEVPAACVDQRSDYHLTILKAHGLSPVRLHEYAPLIGPCDDGTLRIVRATIRTILFEDAIIESQLPVATAKPALFSSLARGTICRLDGSSLVLVISSMGFHERYSAATFIGVPLFFLPFIPLAHSPWPTIPTILDDSEVTLSAQIPLLSTYEFAPGDDIAVCGYATSQGLAFVDSFVHAWLGLSSDQECKHEYHKQA